MFSLGVRNQTVHNSAASPAASEDDRSRIVSNGLPALGGDPVPGAPTQAIRYF